MWFERLQEHAPVTRPEAPGRSQHGTARLLLLVACAGAIASAHAEYPDKPIRVIVPSAPGAGTDNVVRTIAPGMSRALGQQLVIDNRVGAAGAIGARLAAREKPDGYTLLATYATHTTNLAMMKDPG
jgi:tripartite-type tricarboxylate transporter receptor subunit TctC